MLQVFFLVFCRLIFSCNAGRMLVHPRGGTPDSASKNGGIRSGGLHRLRTTPCCCENARAEVWIYHILKAR